MRHTKLLDVYTVKTIRGQVWAASGCGVLALLLGLTATAHGQNSSSRMGKAAGSQESTELHLGAGYADLKSDRYQEAVGEFRAALAINPTLVLRARFPLAVALFELQRIGEARQEFDAVRASAGNRPEVMYYLGRLDLLESDAGAAVKDLTMAATNPPFPDTAYYLGSAYLKQGDLAKAEEWLERAAKLTPQDAHVQERLGALYRQAGRRPEAERAFAEAERLRQRDASVSKLRLDCAQKLEQTSLEEARPVCEQLFDPNDADKLTMLGTIYGQHGDFEEALKPLRRAAELSPNSPQTEYNLALDCFRLQRYQEARDALAKVVQLWPDLAPLSTLYGAALFKLGATTEAYAALHHARELNPNDADAARMLYAVGVDLGQQKLATREYLESVRYLSEASQIFPQQPEAHRLLAEAYSAAGQAAEAAEEQRQFETLAAQGRAKPN